jgi:hypothetical protein
MFGCDLRESKMTNTTQTLSAIDSLWMKAGLFIFQQRGAVDLSDPDSSVIPLKLVQSWMAEFAAAELRTVRAERDAMAELLSLVDTLDTSHDETIHRFNGQFKAVEYDEDGSVLRETKYYPSALEAYAALQGEGECVCGNNEKLHFFDIATQTRTYCIVGGCKQFSPQ